jgi:3-dehydroquinate dehydratase II
MEVSNNFLVINGPNLNLLGEREPEIYGHLTLHEIIAFTEDKLKSIPNLNLEWFQSNSEGEIISRIQESRNEKLRSLIINPGGYAHTSVAILDSLRMIKVPVIEVHLSNIHLREEYRLTRLTAKASSIVMDGLGKNCYAMAILSQLFDSIKINLLS